MGRSDILWMLLCVALTSIAQVTLKMGVSQAKASMEPMAGLTRWVGLFAHPMVLVGLGLYVAATVVYLRVLADVDLGQAYPFVALSYVLTMLAAVVWLGEPLLFTRIVGAMLLVVGVGLIAWR